MLLRDVYAIMSTTVIPERVSHTGLTHCERWQCWVGLQIHIEAKNRSWTVFGSKSVSLKYFFLEKETRWHLFFMFRRACCTDLCRMKRISNAFHCTCDLATRRLSHQDSLSSASICFSPLIFWSVFLKDLIKTLCSTEALDYPVYQFLCPLETVIMLW